MDHLTFNYVNSKSFFLFLILLFLVFGKTPSFAQDTLAPQPEFSKKRFAALTITAGALYGITWVGLYQAWYKNNAQSRFQFFDDHNEWNQLDKTGHLYSTYQLSNTGVELYKWSGITEKKAIWLGGLTGILLMTPIEILDGFSREYGASWSDILANTAGSALVLQRLFWDHPRIHPKFSFHLTSLARLRQNILGKNLPQRLLKDYNGQTYWLAIDIQPWLGKQSKFPPWLNLSLGYGAENMVYADKEVNQANGYRSYRQYYLSLDVNFSRIQVKNKALKRIFFLLNTIHIPAPALEFNNKGMKFHPLYF